MLSSPRRLVLTALVLFIGALAIGSSSAIASTLDDPSGSTATTMVAATTEPEAPEPSAPDSSPAGSTPETSSPADTLVGAGDPDTDIDTTTATIAIVGFVLLVAVASWWMVRRNDPDSEPMPRTSAQSTPPSDLI